MILDFLITYRNASVLCQSECACLHKTVNMVVFFVKSNENTCTERESTHANVHSCPFNEMRECHTGHVDKGCRLLQHFRLVVHLCILVYIFHTHVIGCSCIVMYWLSFAVRCSMPHEHCYTGVSLNCVSVLALNSPFRSQLIYFPKKLI